MPTYYVDPLNGNDTTGDGSLGTPWQSRGHAASQIAEHDTVILMATAIDTEATVVAVTLRSYWFGANASGTIDGTRYVIQGGGSDYLFDSQVPTVQLSQLEFDTTYTPLRVSVDDGGYTLQDIKCWGAAPYFMSNATNSFYGLLVGCDIRNKTTAVLNGQNNRNVHDLRDCYIKDCVRDMPVGDGNSSSRDYRNCIFNNTEVGYNNYSAGDISNCTFYNCGTALTIGDRSSSNFSGVNGCGFYSNAFVNCTKAIEWTDSNPTTPHILNHNFYYNNGTDLVNNPSHIVKGLNSITGQDPVFVDVANDDFSPGASSPLIGAGPNGANIGASNVVPDSSTIRGGYTPDMPLHHADKLELLLRSAGQWIDSSTDQMATFFVAHKTRTIPKVGVICNAITGTPPTYRVEIQTHVNRTPTGTLVAAGASGTFTPTGTGNYEIAIDTPPSLTVGDEYCVVIKHDSGTVDASNRAQFLIRDFSPYEASPSGAETANDWSTQTDRTAKPMFGPIFADGLSEGSTLFGLGSTPGHSSEKGMKFVVPADATMIVRGARGGGRCFQDDIKLTLYDSDGTTVLATETFTVNNMLSSGERLTVTMALPETTLTAGTYYLAVSPAGASTNQIQSHEIDMFNTPMARQFYGEGCAAVERATPGSGAWTENASRVQSLSINGEYVGPAAGGGSTLIVVDD